MNTKRLIAIFCILGVAGQFLVAQAAGPDPLLDLLRQVENQRELESRENAARVADFERRREEQRALLETARKELEAAKKLSVDLNEQNVANEKRLAEMETRLQEELGDLGEIFGNVRQLAGEFKSIFQNSLVSAQIPGREAFVASLGESKSLPTPPQMEKLWFEILRETTEAGRVVKFQAPVLDAAGAQESRTVTRVGIFNALSDGKYLRWLAENGQLNELPRQPANQLLELAAEFEVASSGPVMAFVDPSAGVLMRAFAQAPNLRERIEQGKLVGYVIIVLACVGVLICLERFLYLLVVGMKVGGQLKNPGVLKNNPLGRIFAVFKNFNTPETDLETLELKLDEAIMKEIPALERGLATIKILAAVAPLLGLLGTVTGMIQTFQAITIFGTGDPKLMAGGISEALVTTVQGLVTAIPLVLLHSFLTGRSEGLIQILEEQSAGLVAEFSEKRSETTRSA